MVLAPGPRSLVTRYACTKDFRADVCLVRGEHGPHHQGVLNLIDNEDEDGGTVVVPKFPARFDAWRRALGRCEETERGLDTTTRGSSSSSNGTSAAPVRRRARREAGRFGPCASRAVYVLASPMR